MSVLDRLIGLLAPHECVGCRRQGSLLCSVCASVLTPPPLRCYRCEAVTDENLVCPVCIGQGGLSAVHAAASYRQAIAKDLIWQLKFNGAQAAAHVMARQLSPLFNNNLRAVLVPVPTSAARRRQRGYDQAVLLARAVSRSTGLPLLQCLARRGGQRQLGANRQQRIRQLQHAYRVTASMPRGRTIVLIDDVLTTGATLEAAALALRQAGAEQVEAVVFAHA